MTEEEARQKLCPQMYATSSINGNALAGTCIASDCMAWRFENKMLGHSLEYQMERNDLSPKEAEEAVKEFTRKNRSMATADWRVSHD